MRFRWHHYLYIAGTPTYLAQILVAQMLVAQIFVARSMAQQCGRGGAT
jgi:hypothetical protein